MKSDGNDDGSHQSNHCHPLHNQVPDDGLNPNQGQKLLIYAAETGFEDGTPAVAASREECRHSLSLNALQSATLP